MLKDLRIEPFVLDYLEFKVLKEEAYDLVLDWYCANKKIVKTDLKIESFFSKNLKRKIKDGMIFYRAEEKELVIASLSCRDLFDKLGDLYMEANNRSLLKDLSLSRLDLKLMVESKFSKDELEMEHLLLKKKLDLEKFPVSSESGITSYIGFSNKIFKNKPFFKKKFKPVYFLTNIFILKVILVVVNFCK